MKGELGNEQNGDLAAVYICSGTLHYLSNKEDVVIKQGELLVIAQQELQKMKLHTTSVYAVPFCISEDFLDTYLDSINEEDSFVLDFLAQCLRKKQMRVTYVHFRISDVFPIQNLLKTVLWLKLNKNNISQVRKRKIIVQLLQYLAEAIKDAEFGSDCVDRELVLKVSSYIEHNYKDGELSYLAETMGYKISYLSGEIKKLTGRTYTDLLQKKRLNRAIWMLKYTDLSITEIAFNIGYHNITYFYKLFVTKFGVSPNNYRVYHNQSALIS